MFPRQSGLLKWVRLSLNIHNEMGSLWTQLLLQFLTDLFETLQVTGVFVTV